MSFGILFTPPGLVEPATPVRARTKRGSFKADDPATPDVNEAWITAPTPPGEGKTAKSAAPRKQSVKE